jgi:hypothetical protein
VPAVTWSRALRVVATGCVTGSLVCCTGTSAAAPPIRGGDVCRSSVDHGVEVDTCTGDPNRDDGPPSGPVVRVVPQFCFGLGFVSCDDD